MGNHSSLAFSTAPFACLDGRYTIAALQASELAYESAVRSRSPPVDWCKHESSVLLSTKKYSPSIASHSPHARSTLRFQRFPTWKPRLGSFWSPDFLPKLPVWAIPSLHNLLIQAVSTSPNVTENVPQRHNPVLTPYLRAVGWVLLVGFTSSSNDMLTKLLGQRLDGLEIAFFRFATSLVVLAPFVIRRGLAQIRSPLMHLVRGLIGVSSIAVWCMAVSHVPLVQATTIQFAVPLFGFILAGLCLREKICKRALWATLVGFCGVALTVVPDRGASAGPMAVSAYSGILVLAAIVFAVEETLVKVMVGKSEDNLTMLFSYAAIATLGTGFCLRGHWTMPSRPEFALLLLLGIGANLVQYFLFRAFESAKVSDLAPFRYFELMFSVGLGFAAFREIPSVNTLLGAAIIIPSTLYVAFTQAKQQKLDAVSS